MPDHSPLPSPETSESSASPDPLKAESHRPGLSGLGKRIASRTTDLIALSILVVAGLSMGGSVIRWWNTDPEELSMHSSEAFIDDLIPPDWESGLPVGIAVGNSSLGIERAELVGTRIDIEQMISDLILMRCERAILPKAPPDEREKRMLESLGSAKPVRTSPEGVRVYLKDGPVIWCVGVKPTPSDRRTQAESALRVVCWGLAFPSGYDSTRWSVWLMSPTGGEKGSPHTDWRSVLPESSVCSLALTSPRGHVLLAFTANGPRESWSDELESRFRERGFVLKNGWKTGSSGLTGRFVAEERGSQRVAFVQASDSVGETFRGLIQVSAEDQKEHAP